MLLFCCAFAFASEPSETPIHLLLISPDVLFQHRDQIGLTDDQIVKIRDRVEDARPSIEKHQHQIENATGQLAELLSAEQVDEEAVVKQFHQIHAIEKELKTGHLRLMVRIRNELSSDQWNAATRMQQQMSQPDAGLEQRIKSKISQIEKEVQSRAQGGQPPFDVVGLMQKVPELMQNGQVNEAEAILDRVLAMLGIQQAPDRANNANDLKSRIMEKFQQVKVRGTRMRQQGKEVSEIQELMKGFNPLMQQGKHAEAEELLNRALKMMNQASFGRKKPDGREVTLPTELLTMKEVQTGVNALRKEEVAWRKIAWKPCLIDGLKASRDEKKPVLLWIFIDRPIDDERC